MKPAILRYLCILFLGCLFLLSAAPAAQCRPPESGSGQAPAVSPVEDLMREHGLLSRILLIYDEIGRRLSDGRDFPGDVLPAAADIVRSFIEDYHEKLEEDHVFPRFKKAGVLTGLVDTLARQHDAGRKATGRIQKYALATAPEDRKTLALNIAAFAAMYRPHKAREDTVLFPAFQRLVTDSEYADLGEKFEERERQLFGRAGFETMVRKVEALEKELGIYDLNKFTP